VPVAKLFNRKLVAELQVTKASVYECSTNCFLIPGCLDLLELLPPAAQPLCSPMVIHVPTNRRHLRVFHSHNKIPKHSAELGNIQCVLLVKITVMLGLQYICRFSVVKAPQVVVNLQLLGIECLNKEQILKLKEYSLMLTAPVVVGWLLRESSPALHLGYPAVGSPPHSWHESPVHQTR
jgi:hypothetical protein